MAKPNKKTSIESLEVPLPNRYNKGLRYVPFFIAIMGLIVLSLMFFTQISPTPTGFIGKDMSDSVYCVSEGRDGRLHKVTDKDSCCFQIQNTNICKPLVGEATYYLYDGNAEGKFDFKYGCYEGTTKRIFFSSIVKTYCRFDI